MASMSDTIILDSDFEDSNDGIMVVEQISVKRSRSVTANTAENDRKALKSLGDDIVLEVEGPSTSATVDLSGEILAVLSSEVIEKRRAEVEALKVEYGEDDAGWGVKAITSKMFDQDVVSSVVISILPLLSRDDPTDSFTVVTVVGSNQEKFPNFRVFPPLRVRIDLSLQNNDAKFSVVSSWLLKDHTKRLKVELERRYKKHYGSLLPPIKWLRQKSVKFLQILKHRRIFYGTPDAEDRKPHYITFHDPMNAKFMFQSILDKMTLFEGTDLASASAFDCPICYDHKASMAAVMFPQCKHYFCRGCVSQDLSIKIKEAQLKDLKCLQHGCSVLVDMDMLKLWVDSTTFQRYCDLTTDQFLDQSKEVIRCPRKECNIPMELAQNAPHEVQCLTCHHQFCATCKNAPHPGVPCLTDGQKKQIRDEWKASDDAGREALKKRVGEDNVRFALEDAESEEWITKNAKPCPKCSTPIQKIDGCNKMVCTSKGCKTYFCWLCGKKLDDKNPYAHFSEAGGCNGMLHTRVGADGQMVNPYPQLNMNFHRMGLNIAGAAGVRAVNVQLLMGNAAQVRRAERLHAHGPEGEAALLAELRERARVARPARRAPAPAMVAPRGRAAVRRAPRAAGGAAPAPAPRGGRRRAVQRGEAEAELEAAFGVPPRPVVPRAAVPQQPADRNDPWNEVHRGRQQNHRELMMDDNFYPDAFQFQPVNYAQQPHQHMVQMAPQQVYGNGQNFFAMPPQLMFYPANPGAR